MENNLQDPPVDAMTKALETGLSSDPSLTQHFVEDPMRMEEQVEEVVTETKTEAAETKTEDSSLKPGDEKKPEESQEEKKPETQNEPATPPTPTPSFDELIAEKTGGKFKNFDELQAKLNEEREPEFANDEIRLYNELAKNGVKLDREFFELKSKDYEKWDDSRTILRESIMLEKGISASAADFLIDEQYKINDWAEDGQEPTQLQKVYSELMARDAERELGKLIERRDKITKLPNYNPEATKAAQAEKEAAWKASVEKWNSDVENVAKQITKLTTKVGDKDPDYEYSLDGAVSKNVLDVVKGVGENQNVFWNMFKPDGKTVDQKKLYEFTAKALSYESAVKDAYHKGISEGAQKEVKEIKNVNFSTDGKSTTQETKVDELTALGQAIAKAERGG